MNNPPRPPAKRAKLYNGDDEGEDTEAGNVGFEVEAAMDVEVDSNPFVLDMPTFRPVEHDVPIPGQDEAAARTVEDEEAALALSAVDPNARVNEYEQEPEADAVAEEALGEEEPNENFMAGLLMNLAANPIIHAADNDDNALVAALPVPMMPVHEEPNAIVVVDNDNEDNSNNDHPRIDAVAAVARYDLSNRFTPYGRRSRRGNNFCVLPLVLPRPISVGTTILDSHGNPDYLALWTGDFHVDIFSFLNLRELFTIELVSKAMATRARERMGVLGWEWYGIPLLDDTDNGGQGLGASAGKEAFMEGLALVGSRENEDKQETRIGVPIIQDDDAVTSTYIFCSEEDPEASLALYTPDDPLNLTGGLMFYGGKAKSATSGDILATTTNNWHNWDRVFDIPDNPIDLRDSRTLEYKGTLSSPIVGWNIAVCGPKGFEVIVTCNALEVAIHFRGKAHRWNFDFFGRNRFIHVSPEHTHGILAIGNETHLVLVVQNIIQVYSVDPTRPDLEEILTLTDSQTIPNLPCEDREIVQSIAWSEHRAFSFITCHKSQILVWELNGCTGHIRIVETIHPTNEFIPNNAALGVNHVVASSLNNKFLHVYHRPTQTWTHKLYDATFPDEDAVELPGVAGRLEPTPVQVTILGKLAITTSRVGCALCIYDVEDGVLLGRHNDASKEGFVDLMPLGADVDDLVYLPEMNAFWTTESFASVWAFPMGREQRRTALERRNFEENLRESDGDD